MAMDDCHLVTKLCPSLLNHPLLCHKSSTLSKILLRSSELTASVINWTWSIVQLDFHVSRVWLYWYSQWIADNRKVLHRHRKAISTCLLIYVSLSCLLLYIPLRVLLCFTGYICQWHIMEELPRLWFQEQTFTDPGLIKTCNLASLIVYPLFSPSLDFFDLVVFMTIVFCIG